MFYLQEFLYRKRNLLVLQEEGEELLLEPRLLSPVPSAESYSSQGDKKVFVLSEQPLMEAISLV